MASSYYYQRPATLHATQMTIRPAAAITTITQSKELFLWNKSPMGSDAQLAKVGYGDLVVDL